MILDNRIWGRALVNTGTSLLGTIWFADSYEYLIPEDVNMLKEPSVSWSIPWSDCINGSHCISQTFLVTFINNSQLHKSGYLCVIVVTVLKNRLLYQVYNTPATSRVKQSRYGVKQSWYLVYEEVVPVNTQIAPAANISLGLSALKLRGLLYDR